MEEPITALLSGKIKSMHGQGWQKSELDKEMFAAERNSRVPFVQAYEEAAWLKNGLKWMKNWDNDVRVSS